MKNLWIFTITSLSILLFDSCSAPVQPTPNVLFIAVDDLRPELNTYGAGHIVSPNIDRLATEGLTFNRAYCNVPVCGASRASLLTGIKPTKNRFVNYYSYAQEDVPGAISLPQHFKNNGYYTISNGKIFHNADDLPESWSEEPWRPAGKNGNWRDYVTGENMAIADSMDDGRAWPYEWTDAHDTAYLDGLMTSKAIRDLKRLKELDQPFFLALGYLKPHLPFNAPKKYWDLYSAEQISLPYNYFRPENVPDIAIHNFGELRNYYGVPEEGPVSDEMAKKLIHGYYACVSYTDAMIGRVLDALDDLELRNNTIVILWGDHGWQLGEHTLWCKHSNFNVAMRVPLIISAPGYEGRLETDALVEYIDIFPTLCELAGLDMPAQLHGQSLVPLMENPALPQKEVIYARYIRGESIITNRYQYTEWFNDEGNFECRMLYDHTVDPDENENISELPENTALVDSLSEILKKEIESAVEISL